MANGTGRLAGRLVAVTGASRGIGFYAAKAIAAEGAHVVAIARTVGGLEELDDAIQAAGGEPATLVPLDLGDGDGIDRLGAALHGRWGKLDGLVAAAGAMPTVSPVGHISIKEWTETITVNLTANWRLLRSFDPLFLASENARIVALTAPDAREITPFMGAYGPAKAALENLVRTYAAETAHTGTVKANLLQPYPVRSALRARIKPGENAANLPSAESIAPKIVEMLLPDYARSGELVEMAAPEES